jgi:hypothetical protein
MNRDIALLDEEHIAASQNILGEAEDSNFTFDLRFQVYTSKFMYFSRFHKLTLFP